MDKEKAFNLARQYADVVIQGLTPEKIILFGSYVNGEPNENSDIDIAVIFNGFIGDWLHAYTWLSKATRKVSSYIEPLMIDIQHDQSGFAAEILKTGELIYQQN